VTGVDRPLSGTSHPRILLVGGAIDGGGAERRMSLMADLMFDGTADVAVLKAPKIPRPGTYDLRWTGASSYPLVVWRLWRLLRKNHYDAVVGFSLYPAALVRFATLFLRSRPATVAMEITRPLMSQAEWAGHWRRPLMRGLTQWAFTGSDVMAANSIDGMAECISHHGVKPERAYRVHNLLPRAELLERAAAAAPALDNEVGARLRVCVISRLDPMKRIDTVIEALAALPPDIPWQLWVAGDGQAQDSLEALASGLGVRSKVQFLGWQPNPQAVCARADAFVLASTFEGYSNSVAEAMAIGVPVITSLCSSDSRQMALQGAALGFEPGDVEGLRDALIRLWREPALGPSLTENAARFVEPLAPDNAIPGYEQVVRTAISLNPRRR
jgi:glycosyltransferase involved in cell wall biosynthesis